jgi:perosamine synthetase
MVVKKNKKIIPQFIPYWGQDELKAIQKVMDSGYLNEYKTVRKFEQEFAKYVNAKYCVTVPSGTTAIYCAINAIKISKWDKKSNNKTKRSSYVSKPIINIPTHDGIFAFNSILASNMIPNIHPTNQYNILDVDVNIKKTQQKKNPNNIIDNITIHANGRISNKVTNIEDCSQSITHHTKNKLSTYSFASTKHITTSGQGGAICCDDKNIFDALARIKDHGRNDRQNLKPMSDKHDFWGMNYKFTEIQAAFGLVQLKSLNKRLNRLKQMYKLYQDMLKNIKEITFFSIAPGWYIDCIMNNPKPILDTLKQKGIYCRSYPLPLHKQKVAQPYILNSKYTYAEEYHKHAVYLPSTTNLSDEDIKLVSEEIINAIRRL